MKKCLICIFAVFLAVCVPGVCSGQGEIIDIPPQTDGYITLPGNTIAGEHMEIGEIVFTARVGVEITSLQLAALSEAGSDILPIFEEHPLTLAPNIIEIYPPPPYPHKLYFQLDSSMNPYNAVLELSVSYKYRDPTGDPRLDFQATFVGRIFPDVTISDDVDKLFVLVEELQVQTSQNTQNIANNKGYIFEVERGLIDLSSNHTQDIINVKNHANSNTAAINALKFQDIPDLQNQINLNEAHLVEHAVEIGQNTQRTDSNKAYTFDVETKTDSNTGRIVILEKFHSSTGGGSGGGGKGGKK